MKAIATPALAATLAMPATTASAWNLGKIVDYVNEAKDGMKDKNCWRNMFTFRDGCE